MVTDHAIREAFGLVHKLSKATEALVQFIGNVVPLLERNGLCLLGGHGFELGVDRASLARPDEGRRVVKKKRHRPSQG